MNEALLSLYYMLLGILSNAKEEDKCTYEENELYAELTNAFNEVENFLKNACSE